MDRRTFLSLPAAAPFGHLFPTPAAQPGPPPHELKADLVVVGGGLGGVACALAAARNGLKVVLTEQYDWIGGQLTAQAVPPDEHPWIEERGCTKTYRDFRTRVRDYYRRNYPLTDAAKADPKLNPGTGSVSKLCHEPRVALAVLLELLAPHVSAGRVRIIQPSIPVRVFTRGDEVEAVLVRTRAGLEVAISAPFFVDATETGDLLPLGRVEHVAGAEARGDTREPHAPDAARPADHQAFTVCFAVDHADGEDHTIEKPRGYDEFWKKYEPRLKPKWPGNLLSWEMSDPKTLATRKVGFNPLGPTPAGTLNLWTYRRIIDRKNFADGAYAGDVCLVNWPQNDYWLGNLYDVPPPEAAEHLQRAKDLSLSLLYWMQTEAPRPDGRHGWKGLRLRPELMGTEDGLAMAPYVRESRRIQALFTVIENHVGTDARAKMLGKKPGEFTAETFADSVGVGSYRIDLHPSSGGDNYIDVSSLPFQIPLGALIPQRVENLLPACKNIGTTHVTNGCYRLHPVEWNVGEAVGELVAFCLARKRVPRQVRRDEKLLKDFQAGLVKAGFELDWPAVIAKQPR